MKIKVIMQPAPLQSGVFFDDFKVIQTKTNLIQSNEYYPFGMQTANSWTRENTTGNSYLANGGTELNATSNLYDLEFRSFDPVLGRMHQVDPMTDKYSSLTPYNYSFNAPTVHNDVNGADPDFVTRRGINLPGPPCEYCGVNTFNNVYRGGGMFSMFYGQPGQWTPNTNSLLTSQGISLYQFSEMYEAAEDVRSGKGTAQDYAKNYGSSVDPSQFSVYANVANYTPASGASFVVGENGTNHGYNVLLNMFGNVISVVRTNVFQASNEGWIGIGKSILLDFSTSGTFSFYSQFSAHDPNDLDPSSIGHNLLWLTYPGGNNPVTYGGKYDYSYVPTNISEYPAIGHDRRYDRLNIKGASGLFTNSKSIGADWKFVSEELMIAASPGFDILTRLDATILGIGLGMCALPKTALQLIDGTGGLGNILHWYDKSSQGVDNRPTIRK